MRLVIVLLLLVLHLAHTLPTITDHRTIQIGDEGSIYCSQFPKQTRRQKLCRIVCFDCVYSLAQSYKACMDSVKCAPWGAGEYTEVPAELIQESRAPLGRLIKVERF